MLEIDVTGTQEELIGHVLESFFILLKVFAEDQDMTECFIGWNMDGSITIDPEVPIWKCRKNGDDIEVSIVPPRPFIRKHLV